MADSPCGSMKRILQADEAILDAAFTAHTVRHGCGESDKCEARRVIRDARTSLRHMLAAQTPVGSRTRPPVLTWAFRRLARTR
jgi:hypothetical protein